MKENASALSIVQTLNKNGFIAYFAGGFVRDLLLGHPSDDIDIATNAPPETIQALFPHTVPIGIAFGIILVILNGHEFEVATFRKDSDYHDGRRPQKVDFCAPEEDAKRRDFTINGMFYDPTRDEVIDYVGGKDDLKRKIIRAIGNPHERIREDRLRMIRAIRLKCRFDFKIDEMTEKAIIDHAKELFPSVAIERIVHELSKAHSFGKLPHMLLDLYQVNLLQTIFPEISDLSFSEIQERLKTSFELEKDLPEIAILLKLFQHKNVVDDELLCKRLKMSRENVDFAKFLFHFRVLSDSLFNTTTVEMIYALASPFKTFALKILKTENLKAYLLWLEKEQTFQFAISRIRNKTPVITAEILIRLQIQPGVLMGKLLKEAEKISILERIEDPFLILEILKKSPLWPKNS